MPPMKSAIEHADLKKYYFQQGVFGALTAKPTDGWETMIALEYVRVEAGDTACCMF